MQTKLSQIKNRSASQRIKRVTYNLDLMRLVWRFLVSFSSSSIETTVRPVERYWRKENEHNQS